MKQIRFSILSIILAIVCLNCAEDVSLSADTSKPTAQLKSGGATDAVISGLAPTICDYTLNETTLTSSGWTKIFEDDFTTDLSKWNIWTGGAFNDELQHYQASNLQLVNGALAITAKRETVQGQTTPWDTQVKTFNFTSGRIECKTNVSASTLNPKIRMIARIKLAPGYGMWPAFWSYGDPWPQQGEIDIVEARGNEPTNTKQIIFMARERETW
jgi:beta-glucanase (GH16 family)